jgi:hypothetical protein
MAHGTAIATVDRHVGQRTRARFTKVFLRGGLLHEPIVGVRHPITHSSCRVCGGATLASTSRPSGR